MKIRTAIVFLALVSAPGAMAQTASTDLAKAQGGTFTMDKRHTRLIFSYNHLGFSTSYGLFNEPAGTLHFDPANPSASTLDVTVKLDGIDTTVPELDDALKSPKFFDVAKYPMATFKSTGIKVTGPTSGTISGDLTVHGVTKPVTLDASFNGAGANPANRYVAGFNASGHLKRSDFGLGALTPMVSDDVTLTISAEFDRAQ
jgi:polyisoprenoid-binding protein YceI